jgi:transcription antitermination protein NusB
MQTLFEWDANNYPDVDSRELVERNAEEFAPGLDDKVFVTNLVEGIVKNRTKLDEIIEKAAPDWPIHQIAVVDRNILRLGLYELLFGNSQEVPARVAINESIELAKTFGGENSGRFVNGVLGAVYREMGEPGKDDEPKKRNKNVPYEQMPIEKLGGAVVYCHDEGKIYLALVHDIFGYWTLSKGHIDAGEEVPVGTAREIKEELGLDAKIEKEIAQNEYIASDPEKGKLRKQVTYFLAETKGKEGLKLGDGKSGLTDARWFEATEITDLKMYDDIVPIIAKALKTLKV